MELLYDIPEDYFREGIPFLSKIKRTSKVVIYGKGVYATNLMEVMKKNHLCKIVCNVDSADADILFSMKKEEYDCVLIAILDCHVVENVLTYLKEKNIPESKIIFIEKEDLGVNNLKKLICSE